MSQPTSSESLRFLHEATLLKIELDRIGIKARDAAAADDIPTLTACRESMEAIYLDMLDVRRRQVEDSMPKPRRRWFGRNRAAA